MSEKIFPISDVSIAAFSVSKEDLLSDSIDTKKDKLIWHKKTNEHGHVYFETNLPPKSNLGFKGDKPVLIAVKSTNSFLILRKIVRNEDYKSYIFYYVKTQTFLARTFSKNEINRLYELSYKWNFERVESANALCLEIPEKNLGEKIDDVYCENVINHVISIVQPWQIQENIHYKDLKGLARIVTFEEDGKTITIIDKNKILNQSPTFRSEIPDDFSKDENPYASPLVLNYIFNIAEENQIHMVAINDIRNYITEKNIKIFLEQIYNNKRSKLKWMIKIIDLIIENYAEGVKFENLSNDQKKIVFIETLRAMKEIAFTEVQYEYDRHYNYPEGFARTLDLKSFFHFISLGDPKMHSKLLNEELGTVVLIFRSYISSIRKRIIARIVMHQANHRHRNMLEEIERVHAEQIKTARRWRPTDTDS